jgi:hypothetical protein
MLLETGRMCQAPTRRPIVGYAPVFWRQLGVHHDPIVTPFRGPCPFGKTATTL